MTMPLTMAEYMSKGYELYGVSGFLPGSFLAWDFGDPAGEYSVRPCTRCGGKGYHHGFGEDGNDPDWCLICGGGAWEILEPVRQNVRTDADDTAKP